MQKVESVVQSKKVCSKSLLPRYFLETKNFVNSNGYVNWGATKAFSGLREGTAFQHQALLCVVCSNPGKCSQPDNLGAAQHSFDKTQVPSLED